MSGGLAAAPGGRKWWLGCTLILALLSAGYLTRGFLIYFGGRSNGKGQVDVNRRWTEQRYVFRGKNPYDVTFAHSPLAGPVAPPAQAKVARDSRPEPDLDVPEGVVYPPWAFFSAALFFWVPRGMLAVWYALLMAGSLAVIAAWGFHLGAPWGRVVAWSFAALTLSLGSWVSAIFYGNYPTILVALLVACLWLAERDRWLPAALLLAVALLKPTFAGPFVLVLLVKRRFAAVGLIAVYLGVATAIVCAAVHTSPAEMMGQMLAASRQWIKFGYGPTQGLIAAGIDPVLASKLTGMAFFGLGFVALFLARRANLLVLFGIASVIARLWSYHISYDDNVMIFLLMAAAERAVRLPSRGWLMLLAACALSLLVPGRLTDYRSVQIGQQLIWVFSASALVMDSLWRGASPEPG